MLKVDNNPHQAANNFLPSTREYGYLSSIHIVVLLNNQYKI